MGVVPQPLEAADAPGWTSPVCPAWGRPRVWCEPLARSLSPPRLWVSQISLKTTQSPQFAKCSKCIYEPDGHFLKPRAKGGARLRLLVDGPAQRVQVPIPVKTPTRCTSPGNARWTHGQSGLRAGRGHRTPEGQLDPREGQGGRAGHHGLGSPGPGSGPWSQSCRGQDALISVSRRGVAGSPEDGGWSVHRWGPWPWSPSSSPCPPPPGSAPRRSAQAPSPPRGRGRRGSRSAAARSHTPPPGGS